MCPESSQGRQTRWSRFKAGIRLEGHPADYRARSVGIGVAAALSPTIGFQIPLLLGIWAVLHRRWNFSIPVGIAFVMLTNALTAPPLYYLYVLTGRAMMGRFEEMRGFQRFNQRLSDAISTDASWWQTAVETVQNVWAAFGVPLILGSLPWTFGTAGLCYWWILKGSKG